MKISLIRNWDDHEPLSIGLLHTPASWDCYNCDEVEANIHKMWEAYKLSEPNADNEFVHFLIRNYGFVEIFDPILEVDLY